MRTGDQALEGVEVARTHAQLGQVQRGRAAIQQAQDHALAVLGRDGRDADVDVQTADAQSHAAIVGHALLGDVEPGHDLDAADQ